MAIMILLILEVVLFATFAGILAGRSAAEIRPAQREDSIYGFMRYDGELHRREGDVFGKHEWFLKMLRNHCNESKHFARLIARTSLNDACAGRIEVRSQLADQWLTALVAIGSSLPVVAHFRTFWDMWTEVTWDTGSLYGYVRALSAAITLAGIGGFLFYKLRIYFERKTIEKMFRDWLFGNQMQLAFYERVAPFQRDRIHGATPVDHSDHNRNHKVG